MKTLLVLASCLVLSLSSALAQVNTEIRVKKIDVELKHAPRYTANTDNQTIQVDPSRRWLLVEVELESTPEWADEVTLRAYVVVNYGPAAKDPPKDGYDVLAGNVTIVNLARNAGGTGRKNIVPLFVDSNTVKKYGASSIQQFVPEVAVQVMYKGVLQDTKWWKNEQKNGRFWEAKQPRTGALLNLTQSPWYPAFAEVYEQVKSATAAPAF